MECNEYRMIVADLFDKEVSKETQKACEEHICHCAECREYYEGLREAAETLRPKHSPVVKQGNALVRRWLRIAAMFVGVLLITAVAFAALKMMRQTQQSTVEKTKSVPASSLPAPRRASDSPVQFNNVRLDSILTMVAEHYHKQVEYRNDSVRGLHFHIEWDKTAPLSEFIALINNFEGINLREVKDTIIAE